MFKKSNRNFISNIIEDNLDYLFRFAYFRMRNRVEAEDIVHDAVLRLLEKRDIEIKPESIRLYLFRIVHNLCLDRMRTGGGEIILKEDVEIEDKTDDTLDLEEADRINGLLDTLSRQESEVIRMRIIDNLSFVEISNILAVPQSTLKSRCKSGLEKLRRLITNHKKS